MLITKKQKALLVVGGGILQHPTLTEANKLGLKTILIDGNPDCYCSCHKFFDKKLFIKGYRTNIDGLVKRVGLFLQQHKDLKVVGVYTQGTDVEYTVAKLAKALHLPGIEPNSTYACNNKIEMHRRFNKFKVPQAVYTTASDIYEAKKIVSLMGLPCVVKPADNCASRGLTIVRKYSDITKAFNLALAYSIDQQVLIEEFLEGKEYSVDTIIYNGILYPAGISDRQFIRKNNYAIQCGSLTPSLLPVVTQSWMYYFMQKAAKAIGITNGAFKGDLILTKRGIKILEVTARLSGGFDSQYRKPYSFGINLIKATIDIATGQPLDFTDIIPKWVKYSSTFTVFPKPGVVKEIKGLNKLYKIPEIKNVFLTVKKGDEIKDYKHCANRVVHIIAVADTYEKLIKIQHKAQRTLQIITR